MVILQTAKMVDHQRNQLAPVHVYIKSFTLSVKKLSVVTFDDRRSYNVSIMPYGSNG